jgi:hypothetical protein
MFQAPDQHVYTLLADTLLAELYKEVQEEAGYDLLLGADCVLH